MAGRCSAGWRPQRLTAALLVTSALAFTAVSCTDSPPQDEADAAFADALAQSGLDLAQPPELDLEHDADRRPDPFWRANVTVHMDGAEDPEKTEALLNDVQIHFSDTPRSRRCRCDCCRSTLSSTVHSPGTPPLSCR